METAAMTSRMAPMPAAASQSTVYTVTVNDGVGTTQNFDEAIRWCTMAAIRGHKKAASARKAMLDAIDPKVVQNAMKWARDRLIKEAEAGDDKALRPLSNSYAPAFGAPNEVEAYFWAAIAVSTGKADARRQRDAIVSTMTQADLIKTQQRANEWFKRWRKAQGIYFRRQAAGCLRRTNRIATGLPP
jgi:TPR repeat protein